MFFAHADELHTETTSTLEHNLTQPWAIGLVIFLLAAAWWRWGKRWRLPGVLGTLLVGGLVSYELAPVVGIAAIGAGFILALGTMLSSAGHHE